MPKLTVKGQVTIPKAIREALGLKPGSKITFIIQDGKCILEKEIEDDPFAKWVGYLNRPGNSDRIVEAMRGPIE